LRGGYYTPPAIAQFLANWAITDATRTVLEPSCGDGNLLIAAHQRLESLGVSASVTGVELFEDEAKKAKARLKKLPNASAAKIINEDFFDFAGRCLVEQKTFDVVIGNPPFVRYQDFEEAQQVKAFGLLRGMGLRPSKLANMWMPFLALSARMLAPNGRLAMVIPAELFQVGYAAELRQFLASFFPLINLVAFQRLVFPEIQQEVVLLLAEHTSDKKGGIRVKEVEDAASLTELDVSALERQVLKPIDHAAEKWTKYFLDRKEILLLRELRERADIPLLRNFIDIDVGVVTGGNDFFVLSATERAAYGLEGDTIPLVGRSAALSGILFDQKDFQAWEALDKKAHMFAPKAPLSRAAKRHIKRGEDSGVSGGYKCRIRKEWYVVPAVWKPDVFFLRQADQSPRMVANGTGAICTDTLHRGKLIDGLPADLLAAAFNNSLTFAASEVMGRSYGGGVMTFEPSETEKLPLPVSRAESLDIVEIDRLIRAKNTLAALDLVDRVLLVDGLGLTEKDVRTLRGIWVKLRDRRRGRKRG